MTQHEWGAYLIGAGVGAYATQLAVYLSGDTPHAAHWLAITLGFWLLVKPS